METIVDIFLSCIVCFGVYTVHKRWRRHKQNSAHMHAYYARIQDQMYKDFVQIMIKRSEKKYPKWDMIEQGEKKKMLGLMVMCNKGDTDGERSAAKNVLSIKMKKHKLTINDIPHVEMARRS